MEKHIAVFIVCLQSWLFFSASTMPVPALEEMKVSAEGPSETNRKQPVNKLSPPADASADVDSHTDDLMMRDGETEDESDNVDVLRHMTDRRINPGKKRSTHEGKRRLRLVTRRESGDGKYLAEQESGRHSVHKREAENRDRRRWSFTNAMDVLTDMVVENEQRRRAEERDALRQRLLQAGKRSEDTAASKIDTYSRRDKDFVSFLQEALSSAE